MHGACIDRVGQREAAMEATAGAFTSAALNAVSDNFSWALSAHRQHALIECDIDVIRVHTWNIELEHKLICVLEHVSRWDPVRKRSCIWRIGSSLSFENPVDLAVQLIDRLPRFITCKQHGHLLKVSVTKGANPLAARHADLVDEFKSTSRRCCYTGAVFHCASTMNSLPGRIFACITALLVCTIASAASDSVFYEAHYRAEVRPADQTLHVELKLSGEKLPRKLVFTIDPQRHRTFTSTDKLEQSGKTVTWYPQGRFSRLNYDFVINYERSKGHYDSLITQDWALLRADKMVPRVKVTAVRKLQSHATLEFVMPAQWTSVMSYPANAAGHWQIDDPKRRFDRPAGWVLLGKLGKRSEIIAGVQTIVAAPAGNNARRQDVLAFLNWNLPKLLEVFPQFTRRLLVTSAGDPMWRGGLSGPSSLFVHADRPLVSENRTSTLLHELVHVAMGIHGDEESDWIVEGFAEYYSVETLYRSGGIGKQRYDEALRRLKEWAQRTPSLFEKSSSGATTARAVIALKAADEEIRHVSAGKTSLDDVARELAAKGGEVSLERLQSVSARIAGAPIKSLDRAVLSQPLK